MWQRFVCWWQGHRWTPWHETKHFGDVTRWRTRDCRRCGRHEHEGLDYYTGK